MYVMYYLCTCLGLAQGVRFPGTGVSDGCKSACRESNSSLLQEQRVLLTLSHLQAPVSLSYEETVGDKDLRQWSICCLFGSWEVGVGGTRMADVFPTPSLPLLCG